MAAYYRYYLHMARHNNPTHIAIRTKRYNLLLFYGTDWKGADTPPAWELYDLRHDSSENNNLYDNPEYAREVAELKSQIKQLRRTYKANGPEFAFNRVIEEYWDDDAEARAREERKRP